MSLRQEIEELENVKNFLHKVKVNLFKKHDRERYATQCIKSIENVQEVLLTLASASDILFLRDDE